jgi:TIGR03009 family protein
MSLTSFKTILSLVLSSCVFGVGVGSASRSALGAQEADAVKSACQEKETDARLDAVLREWRKAEKATPDRHFSFKRNEEDVTFGRKSVFRGEAVVHKPNLLRVDLNDANGKLSDVLLCNSKSIRWYQYANKGVLSSDLPDTFGFPEKPDQYPEGFFNELIGGALQQFAWRFMGTLANETSDRFRFTVRKEDKNWIYLLIEPRKRGRRLDFDAAQVVLDASSYRVRQFWMRSSSGDTSTWDFDDKDIDNKAVTPDSISKGLPDDFENVTFPPARAKKDNGMR